MTREDYLFIYLFSKIKNMLCLLFYYTSTFFFIWHNGVLLQVDNLILLMVMNILSICI